MLCGSVKYATKITSQLKRKSKMYIYESEEKTGGKIDRERECTTVERERGSDGERGEKERAREKGREREDSLTGRWTEKERE